MESKFKKFVNDNKSFVVFYLIWLLLHIILISVSENDWRNEDFWPFGRSDFRAYNITEFLFYLVVPVIIFGIWKLIGKDIKQKIDENN